MTTTTIELGKPVRGTVPASRWTDALSALLYRVQLFGRSVRWPAQTAPEAALALLRLADAYEATQPSYAADLRTAGRQALGDRDAD